MSIHKSKGLEFPVLFLCGTGKQFNMQDLNKSLLLHQDLGFGPKYINYERKIEYSTLAKEALRVVLKNEILSEEMRLLYVALTRSKEKLIMTGINKTDNSNGSNSKEVKKAKCYLDWMKFVIGKNEIDISDVLDVHYHNEENVGAGFASAGSKAGRNHAPLQIPNIDTNASQYKQIEELFSWEYPNKELTRNKRKKFSNGDIKL